MPFRKILPTALCDLRLPKDASRSRNSKRNRDNGATHFRHSTRVTVQIYIINALTAPNGKISGQDGAAELLGLIRVPSVEDRKYRIDVKGLERE